MKMTPQTAARIRAVAVALRDLAFRYRFEIANGLILGALLLRGWEPLQRLNAPKAGSRRRRRG